MATASKIGIRGVDTTMYLVQDVERAKKFYTDLLGFGPTLEFLPNYSARIASPSCSEFSGVTTCSIARMSLHS